MRGRKGFSVEFLLGTLITIAFAILTMSWWLKAICLFFAAAILVALIQQTVNGERQKWICSALAVVIVIGVGARPVSDQFNMDAVLRDYEAKRNLVAEYEAHDQSLKRIVAQYDRLRHAQSVLDSFRGLTNTAQSAAIDRESVEDVKNALNNFDAIATPAGAGLKVKLGSNLYRIIYPAPMRMVPKIAFTDLPPGTTPDILEQSTLGFTVLFMPLSRTVDHFGIIANAEL